MLCHLAIWISFNLFTFTTCIISYSCPIPFLSFPIHAHFISFLSAQMEGQKIWNKTKWNEMKWNQMIEVGELLAIFFPVDFYHLNILTASPSQYYHHISSSYFTNIHSWSKMLSFTPSGKSRIIMVRSPVMLKSMKIHPATKTAAKAAW